MERVFSTYDVERAIRTLAAQFSHVIVRGVYQMTPAIMVRWELLEDLKPQRWTAASMSQKPVRDRWQREGGILIDVQADFRFPAGVAGGVVWPEAPLGARALAGWRAGQVLDTLVIAAPPNWDAHRRLIECRAPAPKTILETVAKMQAWRNTPEGQRAADAIGAPYMPAIRRTDDLDMWDYHTAVAGWHFEEVWPMMLRHPPERQEAYIAVYEALEESFGILEPFMVPKSWFMERKMPSWWKALTSMKRWGQIEWGEGYIVYDVPALIPGEARLAKRERERRHALGDLAALRALMAGLRPLPLLPEVEPPQAVPKSRRSAESPLFGGRVHGTVGQAGS